MSAFPSGMLAACAMLAISGCTSVLAPLIKPQTETTAPDIAAGAWVLDPAHTAVVFKIDHLGFSSYVGRFESVSATMDGDPKNPAAARLTASVDIASLDIANDSFAKTLTGPDWFDAARYPTATFTSTKIVMTGAATATVDGLLTLAGKTQPVTLFARFNGGAPDRLRGGEAAGFSATAEIDRSAFGLNKLQGLLTNKVTLELEAEFLRK
jgi:polyisoprenoid-binding protein YceI